MTNKQKTILAFASAVVITATAFGLVYYNSRKRRLIRNAINEWRGFGSKVIRDGKIVRKGGLENQKGFAQRVADYWRSVNLNYSGLDTNVAWSSAFISFIMKKSGLDDFFNPTASHSNYINDFKENRKKGVDKGFVAYKINEVPIEEGDLVCYTRQNGITYDTKGNYKSHCDLVVKKRKNEIEVIGGNVANSVAKRILKLDEKGRIDDTTKNWFVTIKNKL